MRVSPVSSSAFTNKNRVVKPIGSNKKLLSESRGASVVGLASSFLTGVTISSVIALATSGLYMLGKKPNSMVSLLSSKIRL
jgi:hypothetical protein